MSDVTEIPPWVDHPPRPRSTNGLAVASLVLSIVWIGGLGSLSAVFVGVRARRQIAESRGAQAGDGLALAGFAIGIVGILVALLFWTLVEIWLRASLAPPAETTYLPYGQPFTGLIGTMTVQALQHPVTSEVPGLQPQSGREFAAARVHWCGPSLGGQNAEAAFVKMSFSLALSSGRRVFASVNDAVLPGLDQIGGIALGSCGTGYVTFEDERGSTPVGVQYTDEFLSTHIYEWRRARSY